MVFLLRDGVAVHLPVRDSTEMNVYYSFSFYASFFPLLCAPFRLPS